MNNMRVEKPCEVNLKIGCFIVSVRKAFAIFLLATSLLSSGQYTLISLQTSLNVDEGLGATSLALHFGVTLVAAILSPAYLQFFSVKTSLLFGDLGAIIYCLSNLYPKSYILLPGNFIYGIAKASFWIASGSYIVFYAKLFAKAKGSAHGVYCNICSGYHLAAMTSSQIFGSLVTSFIFDTDFENDNNNSNAKMFVMQYNNTLYNFNESTSAIRFQISDVCGAKDCQVPNITDQFSSSYKPTSLLAVYLVMGTFSALTFLGFFLHAIFAPSEGVVFKVEDVQTPNKVMERAASIPKPLPMDTLHFEHLDESTTHENNLQRDKNTDEKKIPTCCWLKSRRKQNADKFQKVFDEIRETLKQFVEPNQLLLMGMQFFAGFNKSFQFGDLTRAYTSCVFGVAQIGFGLALYNTAVFTFSFASGRIAGRFGRPIPIGFAFLVHLGLMLFCLKWIPNENSSVWIIFALYLLFGVVDSVWFSTITASVANFFPDNSSRGYSCYISFLTLANLVGFSWSTSVCVDVKIYVQIAVLFIATTMQLLAERRLFLTRKRSVSEEGNAGYLSQKDDS